MKIAIFGLSADPFHSGHREIIEYLSNNFDKVIVIPTSIRYYKKNLNMFSFNERFETTKQKVKDLKNVVVSDIERNVSETWRFSDTLEKVISDCNYQYSSLSVLPNGEIKDDEKIEFSVAMGLDSFLKLKTWANWKKIVDTTNIIVFGRPGYDKPTSTDIPYTFVPLDNDASSTELRNKINGLMSDDDFEDTMSDIGFSLDKNLNVINF